MTTFSFHSECESTRKCGELKIWMTAKWFATTIIHSTKLLQSHDKFRNKWNCWCSAPSTQMITRFMLRKIDSIPVSRHLTQSNEQNYWSFAFWFFGMYQIESAEGVCILFIATIRLKSAQDAYIPIENDGDRINALRIYFSFSMFTDWSDSLPIKYWNCNDPPIRIVMTLYILRSCDTLCEHSHFIWFDNKVTEFYICRYMPADIFNGSIYMWIILPFMALYFHVAYYIRIWLFAFLWCLSVCLNNYEFYLCV